jgi:hypothetical protein
MQRWTFAPQGMKVYFNARCFEPLFADTVWLGGFFDFNSSYLRRIFEFPNAASTSNFCASEKMGCAFLARMRRFIVHNKRLMRWHSHCIYINESLYWIETHFGRYES